MTSDDDSDLARAIALSMEDQVIVISSDEDEEPVAPKLTKPRTKESKPNPTPPAGANPLGDRAQMERERLARLKRLRGSPSPPPSVASVDDDEDDGTGSEGSARKRARLEKSASSNGRRSFPQGAVLRVETQHAQPADTPGIRLSDILGPRDDIAFAVLSSYVVDLPWLYAFFDPATPVVLVADPKSAGPAADTTRTTLKNVFPNWVRVCPPLANAAGYGCMHMKYMLLFSRSTKALRVVVSTANLVPHDWRDIENYVYIIDVPAAHGAEHTARLRSGEKPGESFPAVLAGVLRATGVEDALRIMAQQGHTSLPLPGAKSSPHLEKGWDWSGCSAALVPSVAGRWEGWAGPRAVVWQGQTRLMRAVQALGCAIPEGAQTPKGLGKRKALALELDCLGSSMGTYTAPWLALFRLCAAGRAEGVQGLVDRGRRKLPPQHTPLRILFPTLATVRANALGEAGAGTVFCRRAQWVKLSALIEGGVEVRDARSRSGEGRVGMHTKMILGTISSRSVAANSDEGSNGSDEEDEEEEEEEDDEEIQVIERKRPHAWVYVGSHNFTPSAWGTIGGSGFNPVLNITNYELGVVLRLETPADADAVIAWERPARRYARGDVPWMQEESPFFAE